ncbi:hypothetical protein [Hymenobacter sp. BRD67]|uniref:hypothetical protein n=1 Tax=Hymenobacter sp. BRD67 TaxID=2675877 RepID=UPI001566448B|nr:hypothetical protein [Hymenobacter sp. BRD67]QKG51687.1 hypothetical protein GKZ67_02610 [Hymenobacter sp. BRD67]
MTEAEKYGLLVNMIVPIVSAIGAAYVSFRVAKNQIDGDRSLFLAQLESDSQAERDRENIKNINKLNNFVWLLNNIVKYATKQNEDYLKVIEGINKNKLGQNVFISRASSDIARILQVNQEEVFLALIAKARDTQDNRDRVSKLFSKLDYVKAIIDDVKSKFEGYNLTIHSITTDYRQHIENVRESISDAAEGIRQKNPALFQADDLFVFLNKTLVDYSQNMPKSAGIEWHHPNFLRPVQEYLATNFLRDSRIQNVLVEGRRASILAGRIIHEAESIISVLTQYNVALGTVLKELKTECEFVESVLMTT